MADERIYDMTLTIPIGTDRAPVDRNDATNRYVTLQSIADLPPIVEENTAGSGAPNILTAAESGSVMTNAGSAATNYHTLPTAVAGLTFTFIDDDASDLIRIVANTSDVIRVGSSVSISAGYIESTGRGDVITLVAVNASDWIAISIIGTWNLETS